MAVALALMVMVSCDSAGGPVAVPERGTVAVAGVALPSQLLGLQVQVEDVSKLLDRAQRPYIERVGLFSFRENDLVRATFQVSKFRTIADSDNLGFRSQIINLLGSAEPQPVRIGETIVYSTIGNEQQIFAWFEQGGFFVLTTHRDYEFPRTLLRRLVSLEKKL